MRVAKAAMQGAKLTDIAAAEGVSAKTVARDLQSPQTQALIASLVDQQLEFMRESVFAAVHAVRGAFEARREYVINGVIELGGPDHFARLAAAKTLLEYMKAGRVAAQPVEASADRTFTLEQIENVLKAAKAGN